MDTMGPISEFRSQLRAVINTVRKTKKRYVITRQGKPVAVVISPEELESLEIMADSDMLKSLIRAEAERKLWEEKEKGWKQFREWEDSQADYGNHGKDLRRIGESVEFFLHRHPQRSQKADTSGIQKMHERLSKMPEVKKP